MADVFISYSSKDRGAAERVQQALTARGLDVFWDQATPPGQDWDTWIRSKLAQCKVAIVLWSHTSVQSDNVRHEALVARKAKKLLPAIVDAVPPEDLPMGLYIVQATNLTDWRAADSQGLARLVAEVEARLGRRPAVTTPDPAPGLSRTAAPARRINGWLVVGGLVLVAGATALTQLVLSRQPPPASPGLMAEACSNGLPRLATGECPPFDPKRVLTPAPGADNPPADPDGLVSRLQGYWTWGGQACGDGVKLSLIDGRLHMIRKESDIAFDIDTDTGKQVTLLATQAPVRAYQLEPEYYATSAARNFNLIVLNLDTSEKQVWSPCDP